MSFAAAKKPARKQGKYSTKETPVQSPQKTAQKNRIKLLQEITSKLQMQQDLFNPILQLVTKTSDVIELEEQMRQFQQQTNQIQDNIDSQYLLAHEIQMEASEQPPLPPQVMEGSGSQSRSLPQMTESVNQVEILLQNLQNKRKIDAKRKENASKDDFLKELEAVTSSYNQSSTGIKEKTAAFLEEITYKLEALKKPAKEMRARLQENQASIEDALEKQAKFGQNVIQEKIKEELYQRVEESIDFLRKHLQFKYREVEFFFKQSLLGIRNSMQMILINKFDMIVDKHPSPYHAAKYLLKKLDKNGQSQFQLMDDVISSLLECENMLQEKFQGTAALIGRLEGNERTQEIDANRPFYVQWLAVIKQNLEQLRDNFGKLQMNISACALKVADI